MKNWMNYLKALRPSVSRDDARKPAKTAPRYHEPYNAHMSDRFVHPLSTR